MNDFYNPDDMIGNPYQFDPGQEMYNVESQYERVIERRNARQINRALRRAPRWFRWTFNIVFGVPAIALFGFLIIEMIINAPW